MSKIEKASLKNKILIVEDEETILELLKTGLCYEGFEVFCAKNGLECLNVLSNTPIDIIVLDIMLPDIDGFELLKKIRKAGLDIPILMLTAKKDIEDRVKGLNLGADDYVTKPFSFKELLARINALLRRASKDKKRLDVLKAKDIELNPYTREVFKAGKRIRLTPKEFSLLELFMRNPKRVFTRENLLNRIWGYNYVGDTNIVDVHVSHLRNKLGDRPPKLIRTHYSIGYAFYPNGENSVG